MLPDMAVYFVTFFLVVLSAFVAYNMNWDKVKQNRCFAICCIVIIGLVSGLRGYSVGADTHSYAYWYTYINSLGWNRAIHDTQIEMEMGYKIYSLILGEFSSNPRLILFVSSFLIVSSFILFLYKYSDDLFISVLLFMGLNHFFTSINTYRTYIALAIVIWIFPLLLKKRYISSVLLAFIGFTFHRISAIYAFAVFAGYIFRKKRSNIRTVLILELIGVPLVPIAVKVVTVIFPKYEFYMKGDYFSSSMGLLNLMFAFIEIMIILILMANKKNETESSNMLIVILSLCTFIRLVGSSIPLWYRLVQMLSFSLLLLIPMVLKTNDNPSDNRIYKYAACIGCLALYSYYLIIDAAEIVPYAFLV